MTADRRGVTPLPSLADAARELTVRRPRALRGPNLWSPHPVIQAEVELGVLGALSPADVVDALERLRVELPALDLAAVDAAPIDSLRTHAPGTWWGTLLVRVALELQRLATGAGGTGRVVLSTPDAARVHVVTSYREADVGMRALRDAGRIVRDALRGDAPEVAALVAGLRVLEDAVRPDAATRAIIAEAEGRGIPVRRSLEGDVVQLGLGRWQHRLRGGLTERTSVLASQIVGDPRRLHDALAAVGVPVARHEMARSLDDALDAAREVAYPVRVLSADRRVVLLSSAPDEAALRRGWRVADDGSECVVEHVAAGVAACVLVVDGRIVPPEPAALHPELRAACALAAMATGLDVARVAFVTTDVAAPPRLSGAVVTDVRLAPALVADAPDGAERADRAAHRRAAAVAVVDMFFPAGTPVTVPIVAITGTNGKTTTTRLIAHLVRETGRTVGFTTTDGVYLREQLLMTGDLTGPFAANVILSHREVECAVLETARGGILKSGLGFAECDVAVVMNVTPDHLGLRGIDTVEQLAAVKAVLPSVVSPAGAAVLNADDPLVHAMHRVTRGRVALFSVRGAGARPLVDAHLRAGGVAGVVDDVDGAELLRIVDGHRVIELGAARALPLTFGGLARFQVQNILAAALAAYEVGVPAEEIRRGLASFRPSSEVTPGRLNLLETPRGQVLLDYAHNAAAVAGLLDFVRAMPARRRMALLSAPGDRRDEDLRAIGQLARGLDLVIMKEHDVYRRGRAPGVIAGIMADGLLAAGHPADRVLTFAEEHDAVAHVMSVMEAGDVVIIIADDTRAVAAQLSAL